MLCEVLAELLGQVVANWAVLLRGGPLTDFEARQAVQNLAGLVRRVVGTQALLEAGATDDARTPARSVTCGSS